MKQTLRRLLLCFACMLLLLILASCELPKGLLSGAGGEHIQIDPSHTHDYGEWELALEATCGYAGQETHTCRVCGYAEHRAIPAKAHPTTLQNNSVYHWQVYTCAHTVTPSMKRHEYGEWQTEREASCTDEGRKYRICTVCEYKEIDAIPETGHPYITKHNATHHWQVADCLHKDTIGKKNEEPHSFGEWKETKAPTCGTLGERTRTCTDCGYNEIGALPKTEHPYTNKRDATHHWEEATCEHGATLGPKGYEEHSFTVLDGTTKKCMACGYTAPAETVTYTVTFHYGVKTWGAGKNASYDRPDEYLHTSTASVVCLLGGSGSLLQSDYPTDGLNGTPGYRFTGWVSSDAAFEEGGLVSGDIALYAYYEALEALTYIFKNANGHVITSGTAYEGSDLTAYAPKDYIYYYPMEKLSASEVEAYGEYAVGGTVYYMKKSDLEKVGSAITLAYGEFFKGWVSDAPSSSLTNLTQNNTTFTATVGVADDAVRYVAPGTITKDTMLDTSLYRKIENSIVKNIISSKITGMPEEYDCSILDTYPDKEAADRAGVLSAWQTAHDYWEEAYVPTDFYMAWDGEYIYILADVHDDKVVTMGKGYCEALDNPYENDCIEVWYAIGNKYHKIGLDACGYKLYSGWSASQYLLYMREERLYKTAVEAGGGEADTASGVPTYFEAATGYKVALALPAYEEPADKLSFDHTDKATWGAPLSHGDTMYASFQINDASSPAEDSVISAVIARGERGSGIYELSSEGMRDAIARVAVGWQSYGRVGVGTLTLVLE